MKRIIFIAFTILLLNSCEDDLTYYPLTEPSSVNFWGNVNNLKLYANQFYVDLPKHSDGGALGIFSLDNNSDNLLPKNYNTRLHGKLKVPSTGGGWDFSKIRATNLFLENYQQVPTTGVELDVKHYSGEVSFFRAYYYFDLLQKYGDLPWIGKTLNPDLTELQELDVRLKRNVITDAIIADLDFAIANLLPKEKAQQLRINREIALLFKSRVCLFEGTWEKYHKNTSFGVEGSDGTNYLKLAASSAKILIDENKYALDPDYQSLFIQTDHSSSQEVMLWKKYDYLLGISHNIIRVNTNGGGSTGLTKSLVESYLCIDGNPISVSPLYKGDESLKQIMQNRDKRLLYTNAFPGYPLQIRLGDTTQIFSKPPIHLAGEEYNSTSGYQIYKGVDPYINNLPKDQGEIASISFRYAEALINYAEAMAELGTINQLDIDLTINKLRERAGVAHLNLNNIIADPNWEFPGLTPIINEVRRERRVEFACDGYRFNDLLRWRAHSLIVGKRPKGMLYIGSDLEGTYTNSNGQDLIQIGTNLNVDAEGYIDPYQKSLPNGFEFNPDRDYLLPIPTNEITLSGGTLVQNPNWQ
ncbi:RagB/SusD family nutrient uptake outer membrane protein [Arenibacter sp. ARW7G5Y1]|uniref:RagB/SusD family nutrient uptake outer membrane protein n=1 Tax=Arenibacter sp. ARW7G5Y1 TaxID=2135619 RepID=UPI000D76A2BD|nr:RagB/SusD family nutrient uptake outer membrane protein [Arenibacter sp. ARW7G5Y1]PXX21666.1 putative outer membrane starch-binding protein [Arenibacter sp. ARW7G5Y1]